LAPAHEGEILNTLDEKRTVQELGKRVDDVGAEVVELLDHLESTLLGNSGSVKRRGLILQKVSITSGSQVDLHICACEKRSQSVELENVDPENVLVRFERGVVGEKR
jgi:hypothetical protein